MIPTLATDFSAVSLEWVEIPLLFLVIYAFLRFLRKTVAGGIVRGPALVLWAVVIAVFYVVRTLQFEVLVVRLENEYNVKATLETAPFSVARWIAGDPAGLEWFKKRPDYVDLATYVDTGVRLDAILRAETLDTIFTTKTLLHDGAVIIRGDRIAAAGCLLPLTERPHLARLLLGELLAVLDPDDAIDVRRLPAGRRRAGQELHRRDPLPRHGVSVARRRPAARPQPGPPARFRRLVK